LRDNGFVLAALIGWTTLFLVAGLWPFRFHWPSYWRLDFWPTPIDGLLNFLCFLPFGLLLSRVSFVKTPVVTACIYCLSLSSSVELAQVFLRGRTPSVSDLTLNTLGGVVGALVFLILRSNQPPTQGSQVKSTTAGTLRARDIQMLD